LKPYLFHTDWSRRRKRARFKTRHFLARRKPLAVSKFGVNGSGRGKKDLGLGKRGPKKKRQVRRDNVRRFKVPEMRRSAKKRLGEKTKPWLKVAGTGRRQGTGLRRMGSDPEDPTERGSPPDGVSGHWRPPNRSPNGDYAKGGDSGVNHGSPEISTEHRDKPPYDSVTDAEKLADDRQFPVSEVDRGGRSLPAAGRKLRGIFDGGGRTSVYGGREGRDFFFGKPTSVMPKAKKNKKKKKNGILSMSTAIGAYF